MIPKVCQLGLGGEAPRPGACGGQSLPRGRGRHRPFLKGFPEHDSLPKRRKGIPQISLLLQVIMIPRVLHITQQTLWVHFSCLSFQITCNKCLVCAWNPRLFLTWMPRGKARPQFSSNGPWRQQSERKQKRGLD